MSPYCRKNGPGNGNPPPPGWVPRMMELNPRHWYRLQADSATQVDAQGNGPNANIGGSGRIRVAGPLGAGHYAQAATTTGGASVAWLSELMGASAPFTWLAWVRTTGTGTGARLFDHTKNYIPYSQQASGWQLHNGISTASLPTMQAQWYNAAGQHKNVTAVEYPLNTWMLVVVQHDGSAVRQWLLPKGAGYAAPQVVATSGYLGNNRSPWFILRSTTNAYGSHQAAEIAFWTRALSEAEVRSLVESVEN